MNNLATASSYGDPRHHGARCEICPLWEKGKNSPVPPTPPASGKVKLIIVGEGPGQLEERTGRCFVGMSGQFLNRTLENAGGTDLRNDAWVSNATLCLDGRTLVRMADGTNKRINWLVKYRCSDPVLTVEADGSLGARPIIGWHRNKRAGRQMLRVNHAFSKNTGRHAVRSEMTADHPVLTLDGWVPLGQIPNGRRVATGDRAPIGAAAEVALGTLLGDGCIPNEKSHMQVGHADDQRAYAKMKARVLGAKTARRAGVDGAQNQTIFSTYSSGYFRELRARFYPNGKKIIPRDIQMWLSDLVVAIWYMDDGSVILKPNISAGGTRGVAEICVAGFTEEDVACAVTALKAQGFACHISKPGRPRRILFTSIGTQNLHARISRYVPPQMQYKLLPQFRETFRPEVFEKALVGPFYAKAVVTKSPKKPKWVHCIDVEETHNFVTTTIVVHNCRPQGDNDEKAAAVCCAPRLYRELAALPASAPILALGKSAAASILNVKSILLARGFIWTAKTIDESAIQALKNKAKKTGNPVDKLKHAILRGRANLAGRKVFPTIHPAFVLRLDSWHPVLKVDVERFVRFYRGEIDAEALDDLGPYKVFRTPERVARALAKLRRDVVAVDIETDGINPLVARILCVGVSDGKTGVIIRWQDDSDNENRLIPQLAKVLSDFLATRQAVVFHNGYNFDHIALERDGVVLKDNVEDSLLALHAFASHLPKRLDWAASIYTDANPWKVKFGRRGAEEKGLAPHKMPKAELHFYNFSDAKLTAMSWRSMQDDLGKESRIYEHDRQLAQITKEMQVTGIPVDRRRKDELSLQLKRHASALKWKMRELTGRFTFKPSRLDDVRWAIFEKFGAPVFAITGTGLPSTSNGTIEALRSGDTEAGIFADLLLQWRAAMKVRSTYVDSVEVDANDRAHFNWRVFGTVSGRWSCRLQSCPRWSEKIEDRPRELYVAEPGCELIYFDLSQSEMRAAAALSGDKNFIATCLSGDVHAGNAKALFPQAAAEIDDLKRDPKGPGKRYRDIAKNSAFGILYSAEIATIYTFLRAKGFDVQLNAVSAMFDLIHDKYARYYEYCEENLEFCKKNGWQRTAIMKRKRQIGYFPKPGDVYNFKVQSLIADLMNLRMIELKKRLPKDPRCFFVAQVHDAIITHAPRGKKAEQIRREIKEIWAEPVHVEESGETFVMPAEQKSGERWADFG